MSLYNLGQVQTSGSAVINVDNNAVPYNLHAYSVKHLRFQLNERVSDNSLLFDPDENAGYYVYGVKETAHNNGGVTLVTLKDVTNNRLHTGVAICSLNDQYNKKIGVRIATARAIEAYLKGRDVYMPKLKRNSIFKNNFNRYVFMQAIPLETFMDQDA